MILIVSAVFPPEPVVSANLSYDIACELAVENFVVVISPKPTRPYNNKYRQVVPKRYPFTHTILKTYTNPKSNITGRLVESLSLGIATRKFILQEKDRINLIYANTWPLFAQFLLVKTAKKLNIPVIIHVQDIYPESLITKLPVILGRFIQYLFHPLDRYILQNSKKVITISPYMKDYLVESRGLKGKDVLVIRNWQDDEFFTNYKSRSNLLPKIFTFMFLGNINPSAGVDLIIRSYAKADIKNSKLIIAGNGSERVNCINLANTLAPTKIEFCDAPNYLVPELQAQADACILTLRKGIGKTASPSKLPAYMFSAKPIIACVDEDSDTADAIISSNCGWVLPPESIDILSEMMQKVAVLDKSVLSEKGKNGFEYAIKNFSKKNNLRKVLCIFNEFITE